ncbi:MAG: hypothetical protein U0175_16895 [Caldilineaceae bacterium]
MLINHYQAEQYRDEQERRLQLFLLKRQQEKVFSEEYVSKYQVILRSARRTMHMVQQGWHWMWVVIKKVSNYLVLKSRLKTALLLLIYVVALLLPGHVQAASEVEVLIPKEKVDSMVYQAIWQKSFQGNEAIEMTVYQMVLLEARKGGMQEEELESAISEFRQQVGQELDAQGLRAASPEEATFFLPSNDELVTKMLGSGMKVQSLQPIIGGIVRSLIPSVIPGQSVIDIANGVAGRPTPPGLITGDFVRKILEDAAEQAKSDQIVAKIFDAMNKPKVKVGIREVNGAKVAKEDPSLGIPQAIIDKMTDDGMLRISLDQLMDISINQFDNLGKSMTDVQKTLKEIDAKQNSIIDYLSNQAEKEAVQELARKKAAAYQLKLDAAKAGISILTTIAQQVNPKFAKEFSVVASSALQVGTALNAWIKAASGLGTLDKVFSLSTVVMTGNVLGAVMNVVSLFGDSKPSPEQIILDEIGKLRDQVNQLRTEMHDRFDRIDKSLNTIYSTMNDRFNQIDVQLGKINGNILEVQQSLVELDLKLSRIERNNFEFLNTLGRRPLLEAINGGLGYLERTGQSMPYQPDFVNFENTLHSWATIHAFDPLNAGPTQRDYSDAQTLSELNAYPFDANINYINGWLVAHGLAPIANKRLPSPRDWLFAARAYTQLALEWPAHMKRIDPKRGEAIRQIGLELEAAMRNLSTVKAISNTVSNQLLFSSVITNYENKIGVLDSSIESIENGFMNEVRSGRLGRAEPFLLHGGAYQALTYRAPGVRIADCNSPERYSFELPKELAGRIPGFDLFNLADYLKLGKFGSCGYDFWYNTARECGATECYQTGEHDVVLYVTFDGNTVLRQRVHMLRDRIPTDGDWVIDHWASFGLAQRFAKQTQVEPLSASEETLYQKVYAAMLKKVETQMSDFEHELYGRILNEINSGSLKSVVAEVDGSKALLDTVISLGLPRAASNDEFLHGILYGNQQLIDEQPLMQDYMRRMSKPIEGSQLSSNPRLLLGGVADQRREVLQTIVNQYLDGITAQDYAEEADYIASARRMLDLTLQVVEAGTNTPADTNRKIFLPLVGR